MRIIHVIDSLNDMSAGPTKSVVALANQQYADGHEVTIITTSGEPKSTFNFKLINSSLYLKILILCLQVWIQFFKDQKISNTIQKWTIIHLHGIWRPSVNFPLMLVWPPSVRIISSPRGMLMRPAMENKALKKRMFWLIYQRWALRMVDAFHTTGESEKESCRYLFPNIFSFIVKNGIEVPDVQITKVHEKNPLSPIKFGFLGRIHPIKNIDILIKSWCTISSHSNDAKLIICGPDRENHLNYLKSLASKLDAENIFFRNEVYGEEKKQFFEEIDCLILPSKSENFGMVVAEALAHGVPVICTSTAPWSELNDQKIGWSITISVDRLANTIKDAMDAELKEMGMHGRAYVLEALSWPALSKEMAFHYASCISNDRRK